MHTSSRLTNTFSFFIFCFLYELSCSRKSFKRKKHNKSIFKFDNAFKLNRTTLSYSNSYKSCQSWITRHSCFRFHSNRNCNFWKFNFPILLQKIYLSRQFLLWLDKITISSKNNFTFLYWNNKFQVYKIRIQWPVQFKLLPSLILKTNRKCS